jgi:hypothetical protein
MNTASPLAPGHVGAMGKASTLNFRRRGFAPFAFFCGHSFQISGFRLSVSGLRFPVSNFRFPLSGFRLLLFS